MPRFYFDTSDDDRLIADDDGLILHDVEEAKQEAVRALPDMARDRLSPDGYREVVVVIRDEAGVQLWRVRLSLVVEPVD
jgi:hypothetical protein